MMMIKQAMNWLKKKYQASVHWVKMRLGKINSTWLFHGANVAAHVIINVAESRICRNSGFLVEIATRLAACIARPVATACAAKVAQYNHMNNVEYREHHDKLGGNVIYEWQH